MTEASWYFHHGGEQHGPVSFEELRRAAAEGKLLEDDLVWQEGTPNWVEARTVPSLFSQSIPPSPPPVPGAPPGRPVADTARHFLDDMPHVRLVDSLLDWLRDLLNEAFLTSIDTTMKDVGHLAFIVSVVLAFISACVLAIKVNSLDIFLAALLLIPVAVLLQYTAVLFLDVGTTLIEKSPSSLASKGFLRVYALFELVFGVVVFLVALWGVIKTGHVLSSALRLLGAAAAIYVVGIALSPRTVNVTVGGEATAGEEAMGILAFLAKKWLRLVPFLYGIGACVGALTMVYLLIKLFAGSPFVALALAPLAAGLALGIALLPFATYLVFLLCYVLIDFVRGVLAVPGKLDLIIAGHEGPSGRTGSEAHDS